jgi:pimeloyl-ACP methyl ester carboxylesterase
MRAGRISIWVVGLLLLMPSSALGFSPDVGPPPGANDWNCKPSRAHPRPVVLVHGAGSNKYENWLLMSPLLAENDFCVFALTYGIPKGDPFPQIGGRVSMTRSSRELKAFVRRVLKETGAKKVDLVGHSEGTVMPRYWTNFFGGDRKVRRYVMFTPLWRGTTVQGLAQLPNVAGPLAPNVRNLVTHLLNTLTCEACSEFLKGSEYLKQVNKRRAPRRIDYTTVMTRYDEVVTPYTSGYLDRRNVDNWVLQDHCERDLVGHSGVSFDPIAAQIMLNALDPARAKPVPCIPVLPGLGSVALGFPDSIGLRDKPKP